MMVSPFTFYRGAAKIMAVDGRAAWNSVRADTPREIDHVRATRVTSRESREQVVEMFDAPIRVAIFDDARAERGAFGPRRDRDERKPRAVGGETATRLLHAFAQYRVAIRAAGGDRASRHTEVEPFPGAHPEHDIGVRAGKGTTHGALDECIADFHALHR